MPLRSFQVELQMPFCQVRTLVVPSEAMAKTSMRPTRISAAEGADTKEPPRDCQVVVFQAWVAEGLPGAPRSTIWRYQIAESVPSAKRKMVSVLLVPVPVLLSVGLRSVVKMVLAAVMAWGQMDISQTEGWDLPEVGKVMGWPKMDWAEDSLALGVEEGVGVEPSVL